MAITITTEEIDHEDPAFLRQRIAARVAEYKASKLESRGELLVEIQILLNRIGSIHSERAEKRTRKIERRSLWLEWVVIILILIEVVLGVLDYRERGAVQASMDKNTQVLERIERILPSK